MTEEKRCQICGKETRKVLLKDDQKKIYICSRRCEDEYLVTLRGKEKALQEVLHHLDKKIAKIKKFELCCWMTTLVGIGIMLISIVLANTPATKGQLVGPLFFLGVAPLTGSLLVTSQISKEKRILLEKRKQLSLAYSVK